MEEERLYELIKESVGAGLERMVGYAGFATGVIGAASGYGLGYILAPAAGILIYDGFERGRKVAQELGAYKKDD